ncbi:MAG: Crp/Fnr family transcriptional regulator [Clostridia bacterium]|nr:Crp/Fnr family transcriptional regulator [Clostridia bacterium]
MEKYYEILSRCPLFEGIARADMMRMLFCLGAKVDSYDKKYTVVAEGNPARYIGIVLSGSVQVVRIDYYGNRSILTEAGVGEVFMEAFACAEIQSVPVTVIANEPCELMVIDCSHILHMCQNNCGFHQKLIFNLMKDLATKNISFHQNIEITAKRSTRDKIMAYLMAQAKKTGRDEFDIPFDRQELADYLDVDRSGLSAEISKLREEGVLESHRKHFRLL